MSTAPAFPGDFPDPCVVRTGDGWYAYGTNSAGVNVQVLHSADLSTWTRLADGLPELPAWVRPGRTWSPAVMEVNGRYCLYYAADLASAGRQCISVAVGDSPAGPFTDARPEPLIFQAERGGSIDPDPFVDVDGRRYLYWKSDDNALGRPASLWGALLDSSGQELSGAPVQLLTHDLSWESPLVEAPSVVLSGGRYLLFYSANWWASRSYAIGYAVADSPLGPFSKVTVDGPWMGSDAFVAGPGGQSFCQDTSGTWHMAFHGWDLDKVGYAAGGVRSLRITEVDFAGDMPQVKS